MTSVSIQRRTHLGIKTVERIAGFGQPPFRSAMEAQCIRPVAGISGETRRNNQREGHQHSSRRPIRVPLQGTVLWLPVSGNVPKARYDP